MHGKTATHPVKITLKSINAGLPSITAIRKYYRPQGASGCFPSDITTIDCVIARYYPNDGDITVTFYGVGQAMPRDDYYCTGDCADVQDVIADWLDGKIECRRDAVARIRDELFAAMEPNAE